MTEVPAPPAAGPRRDIPRVGHLHTLKRLLHARAERIDMLSTLREMFDAHGPVVQAKMGPIRFVYLFGPDANRTVLFDRDGIFSAAKPWNAIMGRIFPNGLLLRDGVDHKHHRKIMSQAFKRPFLREYGERMNAMIEEGIAGWGARGAAFRAFPAFKELTLDMAATIFIGADLGPATQRMNRAFEDMVAASMSRVRLRIPGLEFYRGLQGRNFMIDYLSELVGKKRSSDGRDMFSRLCHAETEEGEGFADQEVIDHMIFLMMAAHDTTTSTLSSLTYELAVQPEWQERVREESLALGGAIGFDDLDRLPALTWVMKETLRRYPPLPVIPRIATAGFPFGGFVVPENAMVVVAPIHTHHMTAWWSDPFRFDPGRFAPDRAEDERHTHSWIPFGAGPHHCVGRRFAELQVKAIVHQLVQRYRWSVPEGYAMPVQQAPISKPRDGLPLTLAPIA